MHARTRPGFAGLASSWLGVFTQSRSMALFPVTRALKLATDRRSGDSAGGGRLIIHPEYHNSPVLLPEIFGSLCWFSGLAFPITHWKQAVGRDTTPNHFADNPFGTLLG